MIRMSSADRMSRRARGVIGNATAGIVVSSTVSQPCRLGQAEVYARPLLCYGLFRPVMQTENIKITSRSNFSQRIIALGIVFAFLYWASSVVMTLMLAVLLAYFLDPVVEFLERMRVPRAVGALIVLLAVTALVGGLGYLVVERADQFIAAWPRYSTQLQHVATAFDRKLAIVQKQVEAISPEEDHGPKPVQVAEARSARDVLFQSVGSLYSILLVVTFVPFLVFFMLAAKPRIWKATIELFPDEHQERVRDALDQLGSMLRSFVVGNALIAAILMLLSYGFFLTIHLKYPFLSGCVSGILNLVPYLGVVLAWLPPFLIGMVKWDTVGPYIGVAVT